jgi:hypothetical protein
MSKEEIPEKEVKPMSVAGGIFTYRDQNITEHVKRAMDEYAKQEAISFLAWTKGMGWEWSVRDGLWFMMDGSLEKRFTEEQLYDLYIQSKEGK